MASLIETLIEVLEQENAEYQKLLNLAMGKTSIIVEGKVEDLQHVLSEEQKLIDGINILEAKREENIQDISNVLNISMKDLRVDDLIKILEKQPKEHDALIKVHKELKRTIDELAKINDNNRVLLQESLDMIEFEINLARSSISAPITANYSKEAHSDGQNIGNVSFDAKQ